MSEETKKKEGATPSNASKEKIKAVQETVKQEIKQETSEKPQADKKKSDAQEEVKQDTGNRKFPELRVGYTIRLYQRIKEGEKERVQMFEGIIISMRGKNDIERTMTVRKISHGVGVEKIFPLALPTIEKIVVVKQAKVRRAKLYYLRDYGKRLKEVLVK